MRRETRDRTMVMTKTQMGDYAFMSPNCLKLQKKGKRNIYRGGSRIFFYLGGGGGAHPLHPPPRSAPDLVKLRCIRIPALHTLRFFSPIGFRLFKVGTEFLPPFQYTSLLHTGNIEVSKRPTTFL